MSVKYDFLKRRGKKSRFSIDVCVTQQDINFIFQSIDILVTDIMMLKEDEEEKKTSKVVEIVLSARKTT